MSYNLLWKYLLEDDVDNFRQSLVRATQGATRGALAGSPGGAAFKIGSPGSLATSPRTPKSKKNIQHGNAIRAVINTRDSFGRTILHHAASSRSPNAVDFVKALLEMVPQLDLYVQDTENGWTALHRALYCGNVNIAQALMLKDVQNATDFATNLTYAHAGGLVKIKDHEGNSPFEVFGATIAPRTIQDVTPATLDAGDDEDSNNGVDVREDETEDARKGRTVLPRTNLHGDQVFAFGSNKNLTLGLGDEDDRQYPEKIHLQRPAHLLRRLQEAHLAESTQHVALEDLADSTASLSTHVGLSATVQHRPIIIQEVVMAKLHTAVLTDDPISNLHVTGFGPGGRLGTGDEVTRFNYVCIQGALAHRRVSTIALGQDHSIAICSTGDVLTWGNALDGKLGYILPEVSAKEVPMQLVPRQLYGLVKKEQIVGAAASAIHSIIYSSTALFAFGRNSGQLGLVDADARSLESQIIPRRVGTSILSCAIRSVSAIDRATTILLENHDVIVFTHYAWKKVIFPFEEMPADLYSGSLRTTYNKEPNSISKITNGGNTICALSTFGQVFTLDVPREAEHVPLTVSTTNPNKARNALPNPSRVWSIGKPHMTAVDAAVGQDGSIILCTKSGSVWRKEKRANIKSVHLKLNDAASVKDYKFVRVPNITRAVAVRSNARGAFSIVRKDVEVTRDQITEDPLMLWEDVFPLLSFHDYGSGKRDNHDEDYDDPQPRFWVPATRGASPASIKHAVLTNKSAEEDFKSLAIRFERLTEFGYDAWVTSNVTDVRIPVHSFLLKARSRVLRMALTEFESTYYFSIADVVSIEYGSDGNIHIKFQGADYLTIVNFVLYLYSENLVDVWHHTSRYLNLAPRYRQVRVELMKIASALELRQLEKAARVMIDPARSMTRDFEVAYSDSDFFTNADVVVDLADGAEMSAHSIMLCARCPFFEGLFHGLSRGMWMASRQSPKNELVEQMRIDLKHVDAPIFGLVLRHIYADTGEELFTQTVTSTLDEFIDLVIDVVSVANELMLDRLVQICQKVIGRYVTTRNVCGLLNTLAECSVTVFKDAALEYLCLNLETMLEQRLLEELDEYLLDELVDVIRANQLAFMPFVRSGRAEAELLERYPTLAEAMDTSRRRRIDSMLLPSRFVNDEDRPTPKHRKSAVEDDLPFTMDEDGTARSPRLQAERQSPNIQAKAYRAASGLALSTSFSQEDDFAPSSAGGDHTSDLTPVQTQLGSPSPGPTISDLELSKAAWSATKSSQSKPDFKSIMEQTSSTRVSNLSQALNAASAVPVRPTPRMSQSQRRKQAQDLKKQEIISKDAEAEADAESSHLSSPWSKVIPVPKRSVTSPLSEGTASLIPNQPAKSPARPGMTTRQATAGTPTESRQVSFKQATNTPGPNPTESPKPAPPVIQSIRHTPLPARSRSQIDARTSMADILAQEQADKSAIKEAAAKRSLQEIQQEQEFEAWWNAESRRIQEEETRAIAALSHSGRSSSRGRGGRKRSARGAAAGIASSPSEQREKRGPSQPARAATEVDDKEPSTTRASSSVPSTNRGNRGRGRASGRGRGAGRDREKQTQPV